MLRCNDFPTYYADSGWLWDASVQGANSTDHFFINVRLNSR